MSPACLQKKSLSCLLYLFVLSLSSFCLFVFLSFVRLVLCILQVVFSHSQAACQEKQTKRT